MAQQAGWLSTRRHKCSALESCVTTQGRTIASPRASASTQSNVDVLVTASASAQFHTTAPSDVISSDQGGAHILAQANAIAPVPLLKRARLSTNAPMTFTPQGTTSGHDVHASTTTKTIIVCPRPAARIVAFDEDTVRDIGNAEPSYVPPYKKQRRLRTVAEPLRVDPRADWYAEPGALLRLCTRDYEMLQRHKSRSVCLAGQTVLALPKADAVECAHIELARRRTQTHTLIDARARVDGANCAHGKEFVASATLALWVERAYLASWFDWATGDASTLFDDRLSDRGLARTICVTQRQFQFSGKTLTFGTRARSRSSPIAAAVSRVATAGSLGSDDNYKQNSGGQRCVTNIVDQAPTKDDDDDDDDDSLLPVEHDAHLFNEIISHAAFMTLSDLRAWMFRPQRDLLFLHDGAFFDQPNVAEPHVQLGARAVLAWTR